MSADSDHPRAPPPPIGLFDSGVGGLTVVRALRQRLPGAALMYVGDVARAPYGDRPAAEIVARSLTIAAWLIERGTGLVVVPCNTATALAIEALRARWPQIAFVGVEPGVKPAVAASITRRIAVMATTATIRSTRLAELIKRHAGDCRVHLQPCPGLAGAIEDGVLDGPQLQRILAPHCAAIRAAEVDTVALGCTHYPFVATAIQALLGPAVRLVDTSDAVAERTAALWLAHSGIVDRAPATVRVFGTKASPTLQRLTATCVTSETVVVESLTLA